MERPGSAKPLYVGSIPTWASKLKEERVTDKNYELHRAEFNLKDMEEASTHLWKAIVCLPTWESIEDDATRVIGQLIEEHLDTWDSSLSDLITMQEKLVKTLKEKE